jgi:hypothetical protein
MPLSNEVGDISMALRSLYAGIGLLGLLNSAAIASTFNNGVEAANTKTVEAVELVSPARPAFLCCRLDGMRGIIPKLLRSRVLFWTFHP